MKGVNRKNIEEHLFDYLLETIGKTREEAFMDAYDWRNEFTITSDQYWEFRRYTLNVIMETLHCTKRKAIVAFVKFWKQFGVRIKD